MHFMLYWLCVSSAWRDGIAHGCKGRTDGGGAMFAKERRFGGCSGQSQLIKTLPEKMKSQTTIKVLHILYLNFSPSFSLASRRTRHPFTLHLAWVRQRLCSYYCSTWLTLTRPPLMDTHLCTSPLVKVRWKRLQCCWRPEHLTHSPPRWD